MLCGLGAFEALGFEEELAGADDDVVLDVLDVFPTLVPGPIE